MGIQVVGLSGQNIIRCHHVYWLVNFAYNFTVMDLKHELAKRDCTEHAIYPTSDRMVDQSVHNPIDEGELFR